jgi:serine/threonine protein kinase
MIWIKPGEIVFKKYKVIERISGGGQSLCYKAEDITATHRPAWDKMVFIKQYIDLVAEESEYKKLDSHFQNIVDRLSDSENYIVLPIELGLSEEFGAVIAIFPYVESQKLSEKLESGISLTERKRIAFALLNVIRRLHEQDIAHLDLKPANVVVYTRPRDGALFIKLIDLDGAKISTAGLRENNIKTIGYSSPEHFGIDKDTETTVKSDIFSMAIILLELLTEKYPFPPPLNNYLDAALEKQIVFEKTQLHSDIVRILLAGLNYSPEKRPSAGKILMIFNRHFENNLQRTHPDCVWRGKDTKMMLTLFDSAKTFSRTYFSDQKVIITAKDLRGSGIDNIIGILFSLFFEDGFFVLTIISSAIQIEIDGFELKPNRGYRLLLTQKVSLNGKRFNLHCRYC